MFLQILLAAFLGSLLGLERELAGKVAGMRTYALVALGSTIFSLMSRFAFDEFIGITNFDPARIAAQIVVGVGFIGAGTIVFSQEKVRGITTAAGLWVSAAIGMAVAYKFYTLAIAAALLTLLIFVVMWRIENYLEKRFRFSKK